MNDKIKDYFDALAPRWDSFGNPNASYISKLVSMLQITEEDDVLDLGCGTGVLTPFLLETKAKSITGLDISPSMIEVACKKHQDSRLHYLSGDYYAHQGQYDVIVCFNAYPHFLDAPSFNEKAFCLLESGGRLLIAHDCGREMLNSHHDAYAKGVSRHLKNVEEEVEPFLAHFKLADCHEDDSSFYFMMTKK